MMTAQQVLSIVLPILGLIIALLGFLFGRADAAKKALKERLHDIIEETRSETKSAFKLDSIEKSMNELSLAFCSQVTTLETRINVHEKEAHGKYDEIVRVVASAASAHKRIDDVCGRVGELERRQMRISGT